MRDMLETLGQTMDRLTKQYQLSDLDSINVTGMTDDEIEQLAIEHCERLGICDQADAIPMAYDRLYFARLSTLG